MEWKKAKLRLAMPALIEYDNFQQNIELCRKLDLDFVEVNLNLPYCDPDRLLSFFHNNRGSMKGVRISIHLPEEIDIANYHKTIRSGFIKFIKEAIAISGELNAPILNLHVQPGIYFTLPDRKEWVNEKYSGDFIKIFSDSLAELDECAGNSDCKICFENTRINKYALDCFREIRKYDSLYYTWDVGHDASSGFKFSEFLANDFSNVAHMHLHDFDGAKDHNALYSGRLDIDKYLDLAAANDITVVVEVKSADSLIESVKRIRERGLR